MSALALKFVETVTNLTVLLEKNVVPEPTYETQNGSTPTEGTRLNIPPTGSESSDDLLLNICNPSTKQTRFIEQVPTLTSHRRYSWLVVGPHLPLSQITLSDKSIDFPFNAASQIPPVTRFGPQATSPHPINGFSTQNEFSGDERLSPYLKAFVTPDL